MRRRTWVVLTGFMGGCALLGCNLILGSESAVFDPSAAGDGGDEQFLDEAALVDRGSADGSDDTGTDAGPCVDIQNNARHCGACGHDCLGGKCMTGKCQPFVVATEPGSFVGIALDGTHVYWTNPANGDVRRAPIGGGTAETIYDGVPGTSLGEGLVVSGGNVYFAVSTGDGGVYRCPAAGCGATAPAAVVSPLDTPQDLSVDDAGDIFVLESVFNGRVLRFGAGVLEQVASAEGFPQYIAGSGESVYWSSIIPGPGNVRGRPAGAATPHTLYANPIADVAVAGSEVFFIERGVGPLAVGLDGGTTRRLTATSVQAERLTVSDGLVYFNDAVSGTPGRVLSCAVAGCGDAGAVIASNQLNPHAIAVDAKSIYWTLTGDNDAGAAVMRVAK